MITHATNLVIGSSGYLAIVTIEMEHLVTQ